ncbi:unnamed protein product [Bubo scandiacus]
MPWQQKQLWLLMIDLVSYQDYAETHFPIFLVVLFIHKNAMNGPEEFDAFPKVTNVLASSGFQC